MSGGPVSGGAARDEAAARIDCPLCGYGFRPSKACASGCPLGEGCGMIKCPNCRYEFVERSRVAEGVAGVVSRWWRRVRERGERRSLGTDAGADASASAPASAPAEERVP